MGTTNTTTGNNTSSLQFNPIAQGIYNNLIGSGSNVLSGYINNPFGNSAYTLGAAQSQQGAMQAGNNNMQALNQSALTNGLTGQSGAGFMAAQKAQTGRANQAMSSQANVQNILSALSRQMSAAGTGMSFSPQLTGQSGNFIQQSNSSGTGTWLPQVASMAMSGGLGAYSAYLNGQNQGSSQAPNLSATSPYASLTSGMTGFPGFSGYGMAGMSSGGLSSMLPSYSSMTSGMPASWLQGTP